MADLLIKDVDQSVIDKLRFRAALAGSTLEIEIHKALREAAESEPVMRTGSVEPLPTHRPAKD